jgi:DNA processing protein
MASALAHGLSQVGVTVVSGAARGVDEAAHRAALKAGGRTVAVLGTGLCGVRSAGKRRLLGEIASSGAVMTEYPLMARGARWTYPERNRLVASLGQATVVVQAAKKSGALITAAYSEVVFAMPGDVCYPLSAGCNALLAKGAARLFSHPRDLIPVIGQPGLASVDWPSGARSDSPQFLSPTRFLAKQGGDSPILAALRRQGPLSIASLSGYLPEIPSLGSRLLELELKQQVVRGPLGTYTIATTPG